MTLLQMIGVWCALDLLFVGLWVAVASRRRAVMPLPRRGIAPAASVGSCDEALNQRDLGDETRWIPAAPDPQDIVTEGLGWNVPLGDLVDDRIVVRPRDPKRERHHPLGDRRAARLPAGC